VFLLVSFNIFLFPVFSLNNFLSLGQINYREGFVAVEPRLLKGLFKSSSIVGQRLISG